jgi:hypothetical protein
LNRRHHHQRRRRRHPLNLPHHYNYRQHYLVPLFLRRLRQLANFLRHLNRLIVLHLMY